MKAPELLKSSESLLIDTDVLIDYLRGNPQAIAFIQHPTSPIDALVIYHDSSRIIRRSA